MYSFHFQELLGKDGWLNLEDANRIRKEAPQKVPPWGWEEKPTQPLPSDPVKRQEILDYYGRWGYDPRQVDLRGQTTWSVFFHLTDPGWMVAVHVAYLGVLVLFTFGLWTRITSVLAWVGALNYVHRAFFVLFGMDTILCLVLFYLMIAPSGAALSLDRLLARYRAGRKALARGAPAPSLNRLTPLVSANFVLRLMQIHLCFIYLAPGLGKVQGGTWWNGTAAWKPLVSPEYAPVQYEFYLEALRWLTRQRWLWEIVMAAGAILTMVVEIAFPFLVWNRRLRWPMLVLAWLLHLNILLLMGLGTFSLIMMTLVASFIPPETAPRLVQALLRGRERLRLPFDPGSPRQLRAAALVHAVDVGEQVSLEGPPALPSFAAAEKTGPVTQTVPPGSAFDPGRLWLIDERGTVLSGYALYERLVRGLRATWPLALWTWIPGMAPIGRALYPGAPPPPGGPGDANSYPGPAEEGKTAAANP
jgi:hypothetical protein